MKTLEELKLIREKMQDQVAFRKEHAGELPILDGFRKHVLVCGGTGCTSSGSKKIIDALEKEIQKHGLQNEIGIVKTGCFGLCALGPIMIVYPEGSFYSMVKEEDIPEIVSEHLANGKVVNTLEVTAEDNWSWSFTGLPKYENGGNEIVYTVTENAVEGYTTSYDGFNVINSYDPEKISITVNKAWADSNDAEGIRPNKVTIKLYADGEDTGLTLTLKEGNSWKGTFADLDKFADGKQIEYTIVELAVKGYNTVVTGSAEKGFIVTNSHTYIPQTGDERTPVLWISLMAVSMLMIAFAATGVGKKRSSK